MNKDLHLVLDAMLRQAKQNLRDTGQVAPFAAILTSQGKISLLLAPARSGNGSLQSMMRTLEAGLRARIGQGTCNAIGTCSGTTALAEPGSISQALQLFLEHTDGTAFRVTVPYTNTRLIEVSHEAAVITSAMPNFFLNVMTRSA